MLVGETGNSTQSDKKPAAVVETEEQKLEKNKALFLARSQELKDLEDKIR